jgi:hypothetical protein
MHAGWRWLFAGSLLVPVFIACGSSNTALSGGGGGSSGGGDDDSGGSSSGLSSGGGMTIGSTGFHVPPADARPPVIMTADSLCKAGFYQGAFTGTYSSNLAFGFPLTVSGNVELTLDQQGSADKDCMIDIVGEGITTETCNNVFTLSGGTITGVADKAGSIGDAAVGGFPYFCQLTGTLDCAKTILDNGWIECTYCIGPLADGGGACDLFGGRFAGPLTANYDTSTLAFTDGTWNGAESLCTTDAGSNMGGTCNNGTMPGPEGGPVSNYLALDGGYGLQLGGVQTKFGGAGAWGATCLTCGDQ